MKDPNTRRRVIRKQKKGGVPLSKLRMSDAVKIISDSPGRLEELLSLLNDRNRRIRDHAAATLARLALVHPSRLIRSMPRLREALADESAYVRWHLVYTLGLIGAEYPSRVQDFLSDILMCLQDQNRIVSILAGKALAQIAVRNPDIIEALFKGVELDMPPIVAGALRKHGS